MNQIIATEAHFETNSIKKTTKGLPRISKVARQVIPPLGNGPIIWLAIHFHAHVWQTTVKDPGAALEQIRTN